MKARNKMNSQRGFTLIEMLIVTAILVTIFGIITQAIVKLQRRNSAEVTKIDMTQQARDFVDQSVRDLHQSGYPPPRLINGAVSTDQRVAAGLLKVDSYFIQFEADTDGSGTVNEEVIELVDKNGAVGGATCPCTIQRGTTAKVAGALAAQGAPVYYTQLGNVTNTALATPLFAYFDKNGVDITTQGCALPQDNTTTPGAKCVSSIRTVRMVVNTQGAQVDLDTKVAPTLSLASQARIVNF